MNDLEELRTFRAEIPPAAPERLAVGRAALLSAVDERPWRPRLPSWRLLAAAGATAAAVAAGFAVLPDDTPTRLDARPMSAHDFLERAARAVERRPDARPAPHQWIYTKTYQRPNTPLPDERAYQENWVRFDGRKVAYYFQQKDGPELLVENVKWPEGDGAHTPASRYDDLRTLPREPSALVKMGYEHADEADAADGGDLFATQDSRHQWVFRWIGGLLNSGAFLPSSGAVVYRALAQIPGIEANEHAKDPLGRPGVAVTRASSHDGWREEFIVDPVSYRYLGSRVVRTREEIVNLPGGKGVPAERITLSPGYIGNSEAHVASAVVDEPGQRP